jgi:hypothetical protein
MASVKATIQPVKGSHLIEQPLGNELVVFDKETNRAHMLDARATAIYRAAENGGSIDEIATVIEGGTAAERRAAAQLGIQDLEAAGLVTSTLPRVARRGLLRTLGAAAMLPVIVSILAPTPAAAASNIALGTACILGDTCAIGGICTSTGAGTPVVRCCVPSTGIPGNCTSGATNNKCCSNSCQVGGGGQCA